MFTLLAGCASNSGAPERSSSCDSACLKGQLDSYLAALRPCRQDHLVYGGEIHAAEAIMPGMPAGTPSGW
jgi:hypothetical protein